MSSAEEVLDADWNRAGVGDRGDAVGGGLGGTHRVASSGDGGLLAAVNFGKDLMLYNTADGTERMRTKLLHRDVKGVAIRSDGSRVATIDDASLVWVWTAAKPSRAPS